MQHVGKYEILGEVGKGAMGIVRKARDPGLDRVVALKTMFGGESADPESRERFLREARSAARLQHPNIITVFELGEVDSTLFIAMEFLEGRNLADERSAGGLRSLPEQLVVGEQLCRGLHYAHVRGVVHRDVKPTNIFILPDGTAKLLDFGIARLEGGTFATNTGVLLGTPHYMAPEQFGDEAVDFRVDMWAVGVLLFEMITGKRPFDGGSVPSLIYKLVHGELPDMDAAALGVPEAVEAIVRKALDKDPAQRFASMAEMGAALREALGEQPVEGGAQLPPPAHAGTGVGGVTTAAVATGGDLVHPRGRLGPVPGLTVPVKHEDGAPLTPQSFFEEARFGEREGLAIMAASPDEQILAVGGVDGSIRMWDLNKRMKIATLRSRPHLRSGHAARTTALCFSADGALLASGHLDGSVYLWELSSGFEFEAKMRHDGAIYGLVFTPDSMLLISAGADANLKYWDLPAVVDGEARRQLRRQPAKCTALAISRDGSSIISGHENRSLRVHDTASGRLIASLHGHRSAPNVVAVSRQEELLVSGSRNGVVRLFRYDTKAQLRTFTGHGKTVSSLAFLADGRHFASVAMDRSLMVWSVAASEPLAVLSAHRDESLASVCCLARHHLLLGGLSDGRFRVWSY